MDQELTKADVPVNAKLELNVSTTNPVVGAPGIGAVALITWSDIPALELPSPFVIINDIY